MQFTNTKFCLYNTKAIAIIYRYFDANGDQKIDIDEFRFVTDRDMKAMAAQPKETKPKGRLRDPGIAWILDFNNDGIVTIEVGLAVYFFSSMSRFQ